jgi:hypothetical protein
MRCCALLFISIAIAATMSYAVAESAGVKRATRNERIKQYAREYELKCKPQLICAGDCQDLYEFLHREGVDVSGPCSARR